MGNPIIATLRSFTTIFEVRCEATGKWLSPAYNSTGFCDEEEKAEMREMLKKAEYQYHKVREDGDTLWITPPVGFWLKDGRLVSPDYQGGERVQAYYGKKAEILEMGRKIKYILNGPTSSLPRNTFEI